MSFFYKKKKKPYTNTNKPGRTINSDKFLLRQLGVGRYLLP